MQSPGGISASPYVAYDFRQSLPGAQSEDEKSSEYRGRHGEFLSYNTDKFGSHVSIETEEPPLFVSVSKCGL